MNSNNWCHYVILNFIVVALCLISYRIWEVGELLRDRHEAAVTAECTAPTVCRNEFGQRKECNK